MDAYNTYAQQYRVFIVKERLWTQCISAKDITKQNIENYQPILVSVGSVIECM